MKTKVILAATDTDLNTCPERVLEEIRKAALHAAQMQGFLAGEKVLRADLSAWPALIDVEMSRLKKAFCWNKHY
ncbi:hypothetical protein [Sphingobacterium deserti]|uniref:Uncharacterized protein n=1 Tax=Sphingobacterium deserti TaxID=1229276 RepID=A0A0B8T662_9SPHI|nr:hypothetical protein [Sphingobacterium deserti]KGE12545.1 hypothetical protein DI53_3585 [Sphingobacterium deserti]